MYWPNPRAAEPQYLTNSWVPRAQFTCKAHWRARVRSVSTLPSQMVHRGSARTSIPMRSRQMPFKSLDDGNDNELAQLVLGVRLTVRVTNPAHSHNSDFQRHVFFLYSFRLVIFRILPQSFTEGERRVSQSRCSTRHGTEVPV